MNQLIDVKEGNFGLVYWYEREINEFPEEKIQEIRQKNISNAINSAIIKYTHNTTGNGNVDEISKSIQLGWSEANRQIDSATNQVVLKAEPFLVGDPNNEKRINQIESSPLFINWSNQILIDDLKAHAISK